MPVFQTQIKVPTSKSRECVDITDQIVRVVEQSGVRRGLCNMFVVHTTAGIVANEHFDPNVGSDILRAFGKLAPDDAQWDHPEGNAPAHVKTAMVSSSLVAPVADGELFVGQWQGIFLMEFDGPRTRQIVITVMGD